MILKRLKSNNPLNLVLVPIAAVLFWLKSLMQPFTYDFYPGETDNVLFAPVYGLLGSSPLVQVISSVFLVVALSLIIQLVNDRYLFIRIKSKLPSILFVIIVGGFTKLHTLHPVYFGVIFLLFALFRLFTTFEKKKAYSAIFDSGFLLGVGALFYLNLLVFVPAFLISVVILSRETRWREFVILLIGFILPLGFALSYATLTGQFLETLDIFRQNIVPPVNHFYENLPLHGYLAFLILFTVVGSITMFQQYDTKKISSRKYFSVFFWIFIFSLISFSFIPVSSQEMLVITAIPVTYLIANLLVFMRSRFWSELLFILLLGFAILMQFTQELFNA